MRFNLSAVELLIEFCGRITGDERNNNNKTKIKIFDLGIIFPFLMFGNVLTGMIAARLHKQ